MHKHILRTLILVTGIMMMRPVAAIDGDYGVPYDQGQNNTQAAGGNATGDSMYGRRYMELPFSTIVGGVFVLLGASAAIYWQSKSARRGQSG